MLQNSTSISRDGSKSSICYEAVTILLYDALAEIYHDGRFTKGNISVFLAFSSVIFAIRQSKLNNGVHSIFLAPIF